ncbi:MAG: 4-hydroxy-tetrahydrodipicolinate reductase [Flavobacteriales bacterium]|nr:4-hydroxy-tetrahydrodipicolinate reductase [Flavobacteriales bacterium]|tara:strand:+ start:4372 stop:5085 length:714 start_codon:yes stop_codon:yes gene_type:complete
MKIAILGYGKMGKEIEAIALSRGNDVVLKVGKENLHELTEEKLKNADVAIEFSTPDTAFDNIQLCFKANVPVVVGTTGWLEKLNACVEQTKQGAGLFYASNFSVGVNVFFEINKKLAQLMAPYSDYKVAMEEIHHTEKLDAPSGTAITLAEGVIDHIPVVNNWVNESTDDASKVGIVSKRIEKVPGTHVITYENEIDEIYIKHTAHNRKGFALGAVLAAEFMNNKSGYYGMSDLLGL